MSGYGQTQFITFQLAEELYGIDILKVEEIQRMKEISLTRVPQVEDFIEGIVNLRGNVIPVVDLRRRFGLEDKEIDKQTRIIVVNINDRSLGFLVDRVNEVIDVDQEAIDDPPEEISRIDSFFIQGIARHEEELVIILEIENILGSNEQEEVVEVAAAGE